MMEEKRGLMGRKISFSNGIASESSKGTSNSKIARMEIDRVELLKYCPIGLTGSATTSSAFSHSISSFVLDPEPFFFFFYFF